MSSSILSTTTSFSLSKKATSTVSKFLTSTNNSPVTTSHLTASNAVNENTLSAALTATIKTTLSIVTGTITTTIIDPLNNPVIGGTKSTVSNSNLIGTNTPDPQIEINRLALLEKEKANTKAASMLTWFIVLGIILILVILIAVFYFRNRKRILLRTKSVSAHSMTPI
ncbi:hypothetical protein HK099_007133 [Clydaea vesicula]|uniref:Uncharacterized protein n=1 Tax=Clydaea vesicula TaxID=447962 RepID=A0AAD5TZ62_9FUNG|nr:hypothetical protein HK099_007133 [Clydaea vesicula]KAJ3388442.1 hypothetical protein HDU92_001516 [Lobulomyces angularis]